MRSQNYLPIVVGICYKNLVFLMESLIIKKNINEKNMEIIKPWHHPFFILLYGNTRHHASERPCIPNCYLAGDDYPKRASYTLLLEQKIDQSAGHSPSKKS